jgi:two-component system chemotaxis response regulator CheB
VLPGTALLCPGEQHMTIVRERNRLRVRISPEPAGALYRPSADVLFGSVAEAAAAEACGVILTGMGEDGAAGITALRRAGGATIGQDEGSSLIYGMARRAVEMGGVETVLPLPIIADAIVRCCTRGHAAGGD